MARATRGEVYLVETTPPRGSKTVDLVLYFGGDAAFLFPKELRGLIQKDMQQASESVIESIKALRAPPPAVETVPEVMKTDGPTQTVSTETALPREKMDVL